VFAAASHTCLTVSLAAPWIVFPALAAAGCALCGQIARGVHRALDAALHLIATPRCLSRIAKP